MTPAVVRLLVMTIAGFFLTSLQPQLGEAMVLRPALILVRPWTVVSYMFVHAGFMHLFFNMLGLFFFGPRLELRLGGRRLLFLYFFSGIFGALLSLITPDVPIVGASGAVFGVLLGFARYYPREPIYLFALIRIEARYLVALLVVLDLFGSFQPGSHIAHFAHLGGFVGGAICLWWYERKKVGRHIGPRIKVITHARKDIERWRGIDRTLLHPINQNELDRLLEKVERQGVTQLTQREREFLDRFSEAAARE